MLSAAPEEESRRLGRQYETPLRSMASAVGFLLPSSPSPLLPPQNLLAAASRAPCRITRRLRRLRSLAARPGRDEPRRPMSPPADAGMPPCPRSLANSSGCPPRLGGPATAETARSRRSAVPEAPIRRRTQGQYVPRGRARRARGIARRTGLLRCNLVGLSTVLLYVGQRRQTTPPKPPSATTGQGGGVSATGVAPAHQLALGHRHGVVCGGHNNSPPSLLSPPEPALDAVAPLSRSPSSGRLLIVLPPCAMQT
jgi:hypothetical protein